MRSKTSLLCGAALAALLAGCSEGNNQDDGELWAAIPPVSYVEADPKDSVDELIGDSDLVVQGRIVGARVQEGTSYRPDSSDVPTFIVGTEDLILEVEASNETGERFDIAIHNEFNPSDPATRISVEGLELPEGEFVFALQESFFVKGAYECTSGESGLCPLAVDGGTWVSVRDADLNEWLEGDVDQPGNDVAQAIQELADAHGTETVAAE